MAQIDLTQVTDKHPYVKKITNALSAAVGQKIVITEVLPVKRVSGVSALPMRLVFAGNQVLELFVRASADVFKANLNGKAVVLSGDFSDVHDFTFKRGVEGMAKLIRDGQKAFENKLATQKVKIPNSNTAPRTSVSVSKKLVQTNEQIAVLDQDIATKTAQRDQLLEQIEQKKQLSAAQ